MRIVNDPQDLSPLRELRELLLNTRGGGGAKPRIAHRLGILLTSEVESAA